MASVSRRPDSELMGLDPVEPEPGLPGPGQMGAASVLGPASKAQSSEISIEQWSWAGTTTRPSSGWRQTTHQRGSTPCSWAMFHIVKYGANRPHAGFCTSQAGLRRRADEIDYSHMIRHTEQCT